MQRKATAPAMSSGCPPALERGAVGDALIMRAIGSARSVDRCFDVAGCNRVDPDAFLSPLQTALARFRSQ
jgi:hypothetical protein